MLSQYNTQTLDHLEIVAGICQRIDLIGQINACVPDTGRKVRVGQAVQAMVLNGLGLVGRVLYLIPEFNETKPVDLLIYALDEHHLRQQLVHSRPERQTDTKADYETDLSDV